MKKSLVAYFSVSGRTRQVAQKLAEAVHGDLFEIEPAQPYTKADLNYLNSKSRSSIEMTNPASRPALKQTKDNMDEYDTVFVGFPIWWFLAPTVVNTFLESCDLSGKTIIPFATSAGSKMRKVNGNLAGSCKGAKLLEGKVFKPNVETSRLCEWVDGYNL